MPGLLGIARFRFHEGRVGEFERLSEECMRRVREHDTGTLRYEIHLNEDRSEAIVIEEYVDEAALMSRLEHIGDELSAAITATADVHGELLGDIGRALQEGLRGGPVQWFRPFASLES